MPSLSSDNSVQVKISTDADTRGIDEADRSLSRFGDNGGRVGSILSGGLRAGAVLAATAIAAVGAAGVGAALAGFKFNSSVEQAQATINAFTKDGKLTAQILKDLKEESLRTQFSFTDMAEAASGLIPASKMSGIALNELIKEAEILAALNPSQGLVGAAFSLKEALSGDFVSIVERFNLPRKRLNELKEQGVPAIEAIRTAMKEMGIDYSLVASQGQTTAARWATMKDQFTQLAGAVTKPIFDKLSVKLSELSNSIDWTAWSQKGVKAAEDFIVVAGRTVTIIQNITRFLNENRTAVTVFAAVVGGVLVAALGYWAYTATLAAVATLAAIWPVLAIGAAVGLLAYLIYAHWNTIKNAFNAGWQFINMIAGGIVAVLRGVPGGIAAALGGLASIIMWPFQAAFNFISGIPGRIAGLFSGIGGMIKNVIGGIRLPGPLGLVRNLIPGFATGVRNFSGGMAVVGEEGPELVNLPGGSDVFTNRDSSRMMNSGSSSNTTYNIAKVELSSSAAVREFFAIQERNGLLASKGMSMVRI